YKSFTVLGTQALFGYEAAGGVQFLTELLASGDIDLLYDHRQKMTLVSSKLDGQGLLGLLKRADRSFECIRKRGFRAANAGQFMVDLIVPPRGMHVGDPVSFAEDDLVAAEVPGLQWLLNAPKLDTVAVDETGWPTPLRVPDPRAFALHKAWLASRPDRDAIKKPRDLAQARAVAALVREHMPHLPFSEAISSLHGDVRGLVDVL
ncbi:MAG: nucleotidyltransferase domain-containing protein, partial [Propionivibrio sp.]|uniref:GSU2403 family nucleotidyltransferase fold protein n=1 Tax=Propionivibrio sp. TaxID=2212460 RepID=UPI001B4EF69E